MSTFASIKQTKATNAILICIEESLKIEASNCIDVANDILKNKQIFKAKKKCIIA